MRYAHLDPGHLAQYAETSALGAAPDAQKEVVPSTKCDTLEFPKKKASASS